jgi:hypothetical protein
MPLARNHRLDCVNAELVECVEELRVIQSSGMFLRAGIKGDEVGALFDFWEKTFSNPFAAHRAIEFKGDNTSVFVTGFSRDVGKDGGLSGDGLSSLIFYAQINNPKTTSSPVGLKIFKSDKEYYYSPNRGVMDPILSLAHLQSLLVRHAGLCI